CRGLSYGCVVRHRMSLRVCGPRRGKGLLRKQKAPSWRRGPLWSRRLWDSAEAKIPGSRDGKGRKIRKQVRRAAHGRHPRRRAGGSQAMCYASRLYAWARSSREPAMSEAMHHLTLQFLAWLAERPRSYAETMEAWRTSCPRLSVWEDATIA